MHIERDEVLVLAVEESLWRKLLFCTIFRVNFAGSE